MPKATSKKQAGLFGLIAGGGDPWTKSAGSMKPAEAKERLRGVQVSKLPMTAPKAKKKKKRKK